MNTKAETNPGVLDTLKLAAALIVLLGGIVAYYWFSDASVLLRVPGLVVSVAVAILIAFQSAPGSMVEQQGMVRFREEGDDKTAVDVRLSYYPPAGAIGHAIASLFGADPKSEMDEDLMRMKSFIETGHQPHDAAERQMRKTSVH